MLEIIQSNPYRVLGVYSNSPKKDVVANKGKMTAFLKVRRPFSFPLDLEGILSPVSRDTDIVAQADANLTLPAEQIKYGQFWFIKATPIDDIAFNHLLAGNMDNAMEMWGKKVSMSSLQNQIVCHLIKGDYSQSIACAETLYANYALELVTAIAGDTIRMSSSDLAGNFLDVLTSSNEIETSELFGMMNDEDWKTLLGGQLVTPLIQQIDTAISEAKRNADGGAQASLKAGTKLMNSTKPLLKQLKTLLSDTDLQYQMTADKLGLQILQCGINYYNDSDDDDAALKAMKLQKYALCVVVGDMAKERCKENLSILENIISKLPPIEVLSSHKAIQAILSSHTIINNGIKGAIELMMESSCHIVDIKNKLGISNQYYLNISTSIVKCVLGIVIEEVNDVLGSENIPFGRIKSTLKEAWRATLCMDKFDTEPNFRFSRYAENRKTLYEIIEKAKGFEDSIFSFRYTYGCGFCNNIDVSDLDLRTEEELYSECRSLNDYECYVKRFPEGKHIQEVQSKLFELKFAQCKSKIDFELFITQCPIESLKNKALYELEQLKKKEEAISDCKNLNQIIELYQKEKANKISVDKCSSKAFEFCSTEEEYTLLIKIFGSYSSGGKLAQGRLNQIEIERKERKERNRKTRNILLCIIIPIVLLILVYFVWGFQGMSTICNIIAVISGILAYYFLVSGESNGCSLFFLAAAIAAIFGFGGYGLSNLAEDIKNKQESAELYEKIKNEPSTELCSTYMEKFRRSENADSVCKIWLNLLIDEARLFDYKSETNSSFNSIYNKTPLRKLMDFYNENGSNKYGLQAKECINKTCDSLYECASNANTIVAWKTFQRAVPSSKWKDSESKIQEIENRKWDTEAKAWKTAQNENSISAYRKYKTLYPKGQHYAQAERKLIDLEVASVYAGSHGSLPSMDKTSYGSGPTSYISVTNSTSYTLTLLYSGPDSKRLVISPRASASVTLKNGHYRVAASVSASNVRNYAGSENLSGGSYSVDYYISQSRF